MTDDEIMKLAIPHLSTPDSKTPQIRGVRDIVAFARDVLAADRPVYLPLTVNDEVKK